MLFPAGGTSISADSTNAAILGTPNARAHPPFQMSEPLINAPHSRFEVQDPREIRHLLTRLINARALLTVHKGGNIVLLSSIISIDDNTGIMQLDTSSDDALNQRALAMEGLQCSGNLERIEIRFALGPLVLDRSQTPPTFSTLVPERLIYLQRREFFRLLAPAQDSLQCEVVIPETEDTPERILSVLVIDISTGGVALRVPPGEEALFATGRSFAKVRLRLPKTGQVEAGLQVRHLGEYSGHRGQVLHHAGCEFQALSMPMQNLVQRYIMRVERERVARDRGLI